MNIKELKRRQSEAAPAKPAPTARPVQTWMKENCNSKAPTKLPVEPTVPEVHIVLTANGRRFTNTFKDLCTARLWFKHNVQSFQFIEKYVDRKGQLHIYANITLKKGVNK